MRWKCEIRDRSEVRKLARKELIGRRKHWISPVMSSRKLEERARDNRRGC
jgi:hypothetical protein